MRKEHFCTTETPQKIPEITPQKITGISRKCHGKSRKITEGVFYANHGNSRIPGARRGVGSGKPPSRELEWYPQHMVGVLRGSGAHGEETKRRASAMMLNLTGPAVRVPLINRRSRSVGAPHGAGRHHGVGEQVHPTGGSHLLLLVLLASHNSRDAECLCVSAT